MNPWKQRKLKHNANRNWPNDRLIESGGAEYCSHTLFNECQNIEMEYIDITNIRLQENLDHIQKPETNSNSNGLKLPRIEILMFSGSFNTWIQFHDMFHLTIHLNKTLNNSQKLHYLKTNITGEAAALIKHLNLSEENYETAWSILKNRFNNQRMLVNTQFGTILSLQPLTYENAASLKKIHDTTSECLSALKNLKIDIDSWDPIIVYILIQKLDRETVKAFEQSLKEPKVHWDTHGTKK